jgi:hypothetical protein
MSADVVVTRIAEVSPRAKARITGVFYLLTIAAGIFALVFVNDKLVVSGDAAATANSILAHKSLFQLGFTAYLIEMACNVAIAALFYDLLKPVNRGVSLLAAFFSLVGCAIKTIARLFYIAPLLVLGGADYLSVFDPQQLQALALLFLEVNDQGAGIALGFFGFATVLKGYLIVRSTFLPRFLAAQDLIGLRHGTVHLPAHHREQGRRAPHTFIRKAPGQSRPATWSTSSRRSTRRRSTMGERVRIRSTRRS